MIISRIVFLCAVALYIATGGLGLSIRIMLLCITIINSIPPDQRLGGVRFFMVVGITAGSQVYYEQQRKNKNVSV